jgi:NAD+ kinase
MPTRLGFILKPQKPEAATMVTQLLPWLHERDVVPVFLPGDQLAHPDAEIVTEHEFAANVDIVVVLGGDGTMLRAAALVADAGVPLLGINLGHLGFLTPFDPSEAEHALTGALAGTLPTNERMRLAVTFHPRDGEPIVRTAMNDAVIHQGAMARLVELDAYLDGEHISSYRADGLIVATPTGSTAYSFSARGPIVSPRLRCLLLTPVSPHMLFDRSLVLDADEDLDLTVTDDRPVLLTIDGRELGVLEPGSIVRCTGGPGPARVVTFGPRDFHQILKAKFGLADR